MFRSHASGNKKQWSKRSSNGNTPAASASGSHAYRQQTLSSFFMGSGKKSAAASKNSTTIIDLESGDEGNRNITAPPRPRLIRNNSSSLFSQSQGSFGDDDPDAEFKKLVDVPRLNSYKKSSRSLSMTSSLHKTASTATTQKTYHFDEDETLREVTSVKSNSRQLSFTSTINIEDSNMKLSTDSERPAKRSKPSMEFQGLKLTVPKKIKPLLRKTVSNMDLMNHRSASSPVVLTMEQERVVNLIVKKRTNVFYTGSAGTGKSVILQTIIRQLSSLYGKESIAITASTGLAAVTIGGSTLHKWSGIGIGNKTIDQLVKKIQSQKDLLAAWRYTKVLIIDEISMVDGNLLDKLEQIARRIRKNDDPFGGIQLVLTGDFFQLPPVAKKDEHNVVKFCFESEMWKRCIQKTILLTKVFRQQDNKLIDILNAIRYGELTVDITKTIRNLNRDIDYPDGIAPTELYATRREVELSNVKKLQSLPGDLYEFKAVDNAPERYQAILDSSLMVEKVVALKEDAQVMMLKNKPDVELVNGSLGKVLFFVTESLVVKMKEIYKIVDDEVVMDMRLVSRVIGNPLLKESKEFRQDLNARPLARLERLKILINYAVKISPHKEKFPYVRWTVGKNKYIHELMVPERFPIDIPRENVGLERTQIPLMLCWALSIHKAQGQTIQRLKVDLRRIFEAGQVYVALSRAVTMDTLQVLNFDPGKIRTNERVKDFYKRLETLK
ncbi:CEI_1a_G0023430.mRNA.1.CDS.1 [Saccharomyces cerevisiae]|nr:EM14S01-3B_G0054430.mRNA.1.CDS.1 [Saccharomyces cerevisiae]CAI4513864.1 AMH_1a_G0023510.mRNA.1.CDS.1 [Saccharomyces cerevisiae]CAI4521863.1 CEI_1a_G0023430.mRNA.1.CDS.1 [Saccharomyces cerevisiae]CAI6703194.1 AMH_1a_G0023510.mRNA.1.CDS.1 [Saccharomyces cerevisiae]CAI7327087.1 CEI_1a_G0023430.mRNA.1.CDS.1 [Saccharomyces cerevisiae]